MKIAAIDLQPATIPLARPYAVATYATDDVSMVRVRIEADGGAFGLGAATPEPHVTGETFADCLAALAAVAAPLPGVAFSEPRDLEVRLRELLPAAPAARAAVDMALHDLWGKVRGRPVVDLLGRVHSVLPTSVTIGVRDVAATLAEAREHLARGFRGLKVKIGTDLELDVERLVRLRELVGPAMPLLVDANLGYTFAQLAAFLDRTRRLGLELVEQPLPRATVDAQRGLPPADVRRLVADESLHGEADAEALAREPFAFGVFNVKLMKCGGIGPALRIARIAAAAGLDLMWGCMDESVVGIAAALHAAFACPATRYLDLDGSFDLSRDFAAGGFALADGCLRTLDLPGLGVEPRELP
jgi:L-alanine-DL-glutamate epimerase-like enolase superfamily enzyme